MEQPATTQNLKSILVTGATGHQGRAFISSLLGSPGQRFRIIAVTRDPSSLAANSLLTQVAGTDSEVKLAKGDLSDPESLREVFKNVDGGVWGVFAVLAFPGLGVSSEAEEKQGYTIADLSLEFGVSHFVYSSSERGAETLDAELAHAPSGGHQNAKAKIEHHVRTLGERGLKWTILRPGFFMENFDGTIGKITVGVLRAGLRPDTKLQMIAVEDIGHVAAAIFLDPEKYVENTIPVIGDCLTCKEQDKAYRRATGRPRPSIPTLLGKGILALNSHTRDLMAEMERIFQQRNEMEGGIQQVLEETKRVYPGMLTFEAWAKKRGENEADAKRGKNWNNVFIMAILRGKQ